MNFDRSHFNPLFWEVLTGYLDGGVPYGLIDRYCLVKSVNELIDFAPKEVAFDDWYQSYPKKANRKKAEQLWNKLSEVGKHKAIVDVPERLARHSQWSDKQYIPAPDVYLRNEKWTDDIVERKTKEQQQEEIEDGSNLARFWTLLKQTYGDERMKREYGETMPFMWRKALDKISKKDIARIINYLMNDKDTRLPDLRKIISIKNIGRSYGQKALPKAPSTKEVAINSLNEALSILKRGGKSETL